MKIYNDPHIQLVGRPSIDIAGLTQFLDDHDIHWPTFENRDSLNKKYDAEWIIEASARNCYMSYPDKCLEFKKGRSHEEHIKHLVESMHGSCFSHVNFNFEIWGISRSLAQELTRHALGVGISMLSQRYVGDKWVAFCVPPDIQKLYTTKPYLYAKWMKHMKDSKILYNELTEGLSVLYEDIENKTEKRKKTRQAARSVLPGATETKIFWTVNGRAVRNVIEQRAHPMADLEIRKFAVKLFKIMEKEYPLIMHGMELVKLPDGTEGVESKFRKI